MLGLAPTGGCLAANVAACAGELLPHLFTLTLCWAVCFCGPAPRVATPGRYPAACSREFGLSSGGSKSARDRLMRFGEFMVALSMVHVKMIYNPHRGRRKTAERRNISYRMRLAPLPSGLSVIDNGKDVSPAGPHGPTHHTICPIVRMLFVEFERLFKNRLPWTYGGSK